jgi:hypothetical protein
MSEFAADVTLLEVLDDFRRQGYTQELRVDGQGAV